MNIVGRRIEIRGIVQGVGFRPWVYRVAAQDGVTGRVRNDGAGVTIDAFGPEDALDGFAARLTERPPVASEIRELRWHAIPLESLESFEITHSASDRQPDVSIPPDLATCPECLAEIENPADRRYRYPFTNCTNCGPRFTIARDVPYDRDATTMAAFVMCPLCRREYEDPLDRRFHAQPNACPVCGPRLVVRLTDGTLLDVRDPIETAAAAIIDGGIVGLKGLGGFHLVCDATSARAVARLRQRKGRDAKPFAVMVRDAAEAGTIAVLGDEEHRLLRSPARPIVLAGRRTGSALAPNVAPDAPLAGVMLPYTPLHYLLLARAGRPLVMTSGNRSEEPIAYRDQDAYARLADVVDVFLTHNREIETGCDDSVARVIMDAPVVLRRSRGFVPRPVAVSERFDPPVLACGALLKNAVCIGVRDAAHLGPHNGDLSNLAAYDAFVASTARLERFLRVTPGIVAYDLHPEYLSTRYALARPEAIKIGVQHHHAHIVSVMTEHALTGPVIGVACDGTGYGTDGTAWGGEIMIARADRFDRLATLRPIPLAGSDLAILEPWRIALALVDDAFDGEYAVETLPLFAGVPAARRELVRQMISGRLQAPLAHGLGRYFDGIGALVLARPRSQYEGQIALAWNGRADCRESSSYPFSIDFNASPWSIDLRPMVRAIVIDLTAGESPARMAGRFHNTIARAIAEAVLAVADVHGEMPVALGGGCFQNPLLAVRTRDRITPRLPVYMNRNAPPGDGGVALGQAVVAAAMAKGM